jgi:hypothetical protein
MSGFEIRTEWEEAEPVRDDVLRKTWARIEILAGGTPCTRLEDPRSASIRNGVYGPAFPLAEWLVENWWALIHEHRRPMDLSARSGGMVGWRRRHCMLFAREGYSLPDLALVREGEAMLLHLTADPLTPSNYPVRFLDNFETRVPWKEVRDGISAFVNRVLDCLGTGEDEDTKRLRRNWNAIAESDRSERDLCIASARLGLDPYDPDELTSEYVEEIESVFDLPLPARLQMLDSVAAENVRGSAEALKDSLKIVAEQTGPPLDLHRFAGVTHEIRHADQPWMQGFAMAHRFRSIAGLPPEAPIGNLRDLLPEWIGWFPFFHLIERSLCDKRLNAIVGCSTTGTPVLVGPPKHRKEARFRLARAICAFLEGTRAGSPSVLSDAHTFEQSRGRSFAAELLCPADGLRARVSSDSVDGQEIKRLAYAFQVSTFVVAHQLRNHGIADLDEVWW